MWKKQRQFFWMIFVMAALEGLTLELPEEKLNDGMKESYKRTGWMASVYCTDHCSYLVPWLPLWGREQKSVVLLWKLHCQIRIS